MRGGRVHDWLHARAAKKAKVAELLTDNLSDFAGSKRELPRVPQQYLKKLKGTNDLWEVRVEFGGDAFRLLGFWDTGRLIVLTNGFAKKPGKRRSMRSRWRHSENAIT